MDWFHRIFPDLAQTFAVQYLMSPLCLATTVMIAWLVWRYSRNETGFIRFLLPKEIYRHQSTWMDVKLAIYNTYFLAPGAVAALIDLPAVTLYVLAAMESMTGSNATEEGTARAILAGVVLFLVQDFGRYCNHYIHHKFKYLWPFHAVHHSAEVMTPNTFMRAHPLYTALQADLVSVLGGIVCAIVLFALVGSITPGIVYGGVLAWNVYVFFGAHLRHRRIWLSYGPVLEHILISPAQHQVHHSSDPKHHDKNFGEIFAIWDWMFGTLYVPKGREYLTFGIANSAGDRIPQPHPILRAALLGPFEDVWEEICKGTSQDPHQVRSPRT